MLRRVKIIVGVFLFGLLLFGGKKTVEAATRIHYLGLRGSTDAILLESDGRFGMIDSGEDWDYPNGKNSKYPLRAGIDKVNGHEQQVIYYMKKAGVTNANFDFYLGTHAHSDHIGTGDEVLSVFTPKVVYLKKYSNANISDKNALWDNKYIYDKLVNVAKRKSKLVQNIKEGTTIKLGKNMKITLYNTKVRKNIPDDNWNSIVAKVRAYSTTTILAADAVPAVMDKLAKEGKFGRIDILKLAHHGYFDGNPSSLMTSLAPKQAIVTGYMSNLDIQTRKTLEDMGTNIRSNNTGVAALVTRYSAAGYSTSAKNVKAGWLDYNKGRYYIQKNGRLVTGWKKISGKWYYFTSQGKVRTGWLSNGKKLYYLSKGKKGTGAMLTGWQTINGKQYYFAKQSGEMFTGWKTINKKQFYFNKSGAQGSRGSMSTGWKTIDRRVFYFKNSGKNGVKGEMLVGWQRPNGKDYVYFKKAGKTGTKGSLLTGWQEINNKLFYFKKTGNNSSNTKKLSGWQKIGGKEYYFHPGINRLDGYIYKNGTFIIDGVRYTFDRNGVLKGKAPKPMSTAIPNPTATPIQNRTPILNPTVEPTEIPQPTEEPVEIVEPTETVTPEPEPTADEEEILEPMSVLEEVEE